jgi:hypothetical protein
VSVGLIAININKLLSYVILEQKRKEKGERGWHLEEGS